MCLYQNYLFSEKSQPCSLPLAWSTFSGSCLQIGHILTFWSRRFQSWIGNWGRGGENRDTWLSLVHSAIQVLLSSQMYKDVHCGCLQSTSTWEVAQCPCAAEGTLTYDTGPTRWLNGWKHWLHQPGNLSYISQTPVSMEGEHQFQVTLWPPRPRHIHVQ